MTKKNAAQRDDLDVIYRDMDRVNAVLKMLVHIFGGDADAVNPGATPGLGYSIQYAARMLTEIKDRLVILNGKNEINPETAVMAMEAAALAEMVDHLVFNNDHKIRFSDSWMCDYFDAISNSVERVKAAVAEADAPHLRAV